MTQTKPAAEIPECPTCGKTPPLCLCAEVRPVPTSIHVLILQHPQEPDVTLGSARLAHSALENSTLRVGLSWPNLAKALGQPAGDASKWAVLYLGGRGEKPQGKPERLRIKTKRSKELVPYVTGESPELEGLVVLDGTWSQAKTLWWRNAWLLKLNRLALNPARPSLYGALRREPRREALSTIEAIAETLEALGEPPEAPAALRSAFAELLRRYRELSKPAADAPRPSR